MILSAFGGGATSSGQVVNSNTAMRAMAVFSCVKIKADSFAQLPCHLFKTEGRKNIKAREHSIYSLLADQPNEWMTAPEFWGMASACLDLRGNFFALKSGLPNRPIRELIPFPMGRVEQVIQQPDYGLFYKVRRPDNSGSDMIPGNRIMHIRGLVLNGFMGLSPIEYAKESIALSLATEKHGAKLFSHGTMIGGVLTLPGTFKDRTVAQKFVDDFNDTYSSVENAHKTALLENGVKWEKMAMTSVDSQFLEARNFQKKEIVDLFFGLPLSMLQSGDKVATYARAEQFDTEYVKYALMPRAVNIEKAGKRDLLTPEEKKTHYIKFNFGGLERADIKSRYESYTTGINAEFLSPNEAREKEDMDPYPGGDEYRTRTSTIKEPKKGGDNKGGQDDES
jgi:HK97 family phage portal protein